MATALGLAIILVTLANVAGIVAGWQFVRGRAKLLLTPRVVMSQPMRPHTAQLSYPDSREMLRVMLGGALGGGGAFEVLPTPPVVPRKHFVGLARRGGKTESLRVQLRRAKAEYIRDSLRNYGIADTLLTSLFPSSLALAGSDRAPGALPPLGALEKEMNRIPTIERRAASILPHLLVPSADTRTFYVLKTRRDLLSPQGRFVAAHGDHMRLLPVEDVVIRPEFLVKDAAQFASISEVLDAMDRGVGLTDSQIRGLRICRVTATHVPGSRAVAPVTMAEAKTAKLVVKLANVDLYRQGYHMQYGPLDTAQVFNGLADLQRRAPQTFTNPDREVLAVTLTPGTTRYEEVEVK